MQHPTHPKRPREPAAETSSSGVATHGAGPAPPVAHHGSRYTASSAPANPSYSHAYAYPPQSAYAASGPLPYAPPMTSYHYTPPPPPPTAPHIAIRGDLPIDQICLMDLVAFYVAKAGPTVEEEIIFREEANAAFDFLTAKPLKSAQNAYYRWRLYSLLQGDTMTQWRTEWFQMERHPEAYVWVPPPALVPGPASLQGAYRTLRSWLTSQGRGVASPSVAGEGDAAAGADKSYPPPSAYWLARTLTANGEAFGHLSEPEAQRWQALLDTNAVVERVMAENTSAASSFDDTVRQASEALLATDAIAQRMIFAIEHSQSALNGIGGAAPHVASFLLDAMVKTAYDAAHTLTSLITAQGGSSATSTAANKAPRRLAVLCVAQLSHLFLFHDIVQNARAVPLLTAGDLQAAESQLLADDEQRAAAKALASGTGNHSSGGGLALPVPVLNPSHHVAAPGASPSLVPGASPFAAPPATSPRSLKAILSSLEAILPTALEAVVLTALAAASVAEPTDPSVLPLRVVVEEALGLSAGVSDGFGGRNKVVSLFTNTSNEEDLKAEGKEVSDAHRVRGVGCMLLSWLQELLSMWANRDVTRGRTDKSQLADEESDRRDTITFRGRGMVLLLERYEWLLPALGH